MKTTNRKGLVNEELNKAIFTVCTTKYKKDAKDAHETVEAYGYQIAKDNGEFRVYSTLTHKSVRIGVNTRWSYKDADYITTYRFNWSYTDYDYETINKIDFVNYLTTGINEAWRKVNCDRQESVSDRISHLKYLKRDVAWEQNKLDELKKEMEKLQKDMEWRIAQKVKAEQQLANYKKEIGIR